MIPIQNLGGASGPPLKVPREECRLVILAARSSNRKLLRLARLAFLLLRYVTEFFIPVDATVRVESIE